MRTSSGFSPSTGSGRRLAAAAAATAAVLLAPGGAAADGASREVTGEVEQAVGRMTTGGVIVTELVVRTDDGVTVRALHPGGRVGGLRQQAFPGAPPPEPGDRVTLALRDGADRRGRAVTMVERAVLREAAFVRTGPTQRGNYLAWSSGCVFLRFDAAGTADLEGDAELAVMDAAVARWNAAVETCSYLRLVGERGAPGDPDAQAVGYDQVNRVMFRDERWCRPATDELPEVCLSASAAGLTTVTFVDDADSPRDGEIVDADVELNGEHFAISDVGATLGQPSCLADLGNTFTHELGHVLGLEHTCVTGADPPRIDGDGAPVPSCTSALPPDVQDATMYPFQACGETAKQSLETDDVAGVCATYPLADDPGECAPVGEDGAGCCDAGGGPAGPAALAALALVALRSRRRRAA